ncbi:hypothetical protein, partial [Rhizobium leguminosarum]|uniref:hypothetical protein n=1 Tax=Rhizobium leguminosarum TaxID=384 RepID=UPI001C8FE65E
PVGGLPQRKWTCRVTHLQMAEEAPKVTLLLCTQTDIPTLPPQLLKVVVFMIYPSPVDLDGVGSIP